MATKGNRQQKANSMSVSPAPSSSVPVEAEAKSQAQNRRHTVSQQTPKAHNKTVVPATAPETATPSKPAAPRSPQTPRSSQSVAGQRRGRRPQPVPHSQQARKSASSSPPIVGPCFAGSSFSESPAAKHIPLPPSNWFNDDEDTTTPSSPVVIPSTPKPVPARAQTVLQLSQSVPLHRHSSFVHTPAFERETKTVNEFRPIRLNPLQLIAAVAAS